MELIPGDRGWREDRLAALGINVILAEDLRKPALTRETRQWKWTWTWTWDTETASQNKRLEDITITYIELVALYIFQVDSYRVPSRFCLVDIAYAMRSQVDLAILMVG